eukprot:COSAG01_NODE_4770_length_4754_cov_5.256713_4_plen_100_part_00
MASAGVEGHVARPRRVAQRHVLAGLQLAGEVVEAVCTRSKGERWNAAPDGAEGASYDVHTTTAFSPRSQTKAKRPSLDRMIWCGCGASCLACLPAPAGP